MISFHFHQPRTTSRCALSTHSLIWFRTSAQRTNCPVQCVCSVGKRDASSWKDFAACSRFHATLYDLQVFFVAIGYDLIISQRARTLELALRKSASLQSSLQVTRVLMRFLYVTSVMQRQVHPTALRARVLGRHLYVYFIAGLRGPAALALWRYLSCTGNPDRQRATHLLLTDLIVLPPTGTRRRDGTERAAEI